MSDSAAQLSQSVRDITEQNMKQAHDAYDHVADFLTKTINTWVDAIPASPWSAGFKDVQERAMDFAKDNAESAFTFAAKICNAQNPQDILLIQTQFAQERMHAFASHTQELCGLIGDAFQKHR